VAELNAAAVRRAVEVTALGAFLVSKHVAHAGGSDGEGQTDLPP
jgi:hypothetical protein